MEMERAKLIQLDPPLKDNLEPFTIEFKIDINPATQPMLNALGINLSQLAESGPDNRLITNPLLRRIDTSKYESDILVFMPFADALAPVYQDHLKSVAKKAGLTIARADDFFTTEQVVDEIWTALLDTKIVIADCTGRNPNVFYELGLAHAVGKPAILITQNNDDVPFDLRHRRYIKYELTPRGMKRFEEELEDTIRWELLSN
jgi:hypothetical protein